MHKILSAVNQKVQRRRGSRQYFGIYDKNEWKNNNIDIRKYLL